MTSAWAVALALAEAGPPDAETSPARLAGARFYEESFVKKVEAGRFDPFEYFTGNPLSFSFPSAGRLHIDWGQEYQDCAVSARGTSPRFALTLRCDGRAIEAEWTWLGPGRARVTGLAAAEPEGRPLVVASFRKSIDELVGEYERAFAAGRLPGLVGSYADGTGGSLVVTGDGKARLGSSSFTLQIRECLHGPPSKPRTRIACLELQDPRTSDAGSQRVLGVLPEGEGQTLVEGRYPEELDPDGRAFFPAPRGRHWRRVP